MRKVRWGVLSTAKIATTKVIPAMQQCRLGSVDAICSRSLEAARPVAEELGIPKAYGTYEKLLADPDLDAVYIPLPNHLHVPWSVKALQAGKHVLCEKPLGLSSAEVETLMDEAAAHPGLKVMEAFMYRFHPQWMEAKRLADSGALGEVRSIQSFFSYYNDDAHNIRNMADIGGGGMMDIGCYCISLSRWIFDSEPDRIWGVQDTDPNFGTDRLFTGMMAFGDRTSGFTCSTQLAPHQRAVILGTEGSVEILIPFNPVPTDPTRIIVQRRTPQGVKREERVFDPCDHYTLQADAFNRAVLEDTAVPTPLTDALANMQVLERLMDSQ